MTAALLAARLKATPNSRQAVLGDSPEIFADIYQETVNMTVWQRQPAAPLNRECQALLADKSFTGYRLSLPATRLTPMDQALPQLAAYPQLRTDIELLAEMFTCLFDLNAVGLRLTPLTKSMCPKFHVDRVPCRLITAYVGIGTEWLPHTSAAYPALGQGQNPAESRLASQQTRQTLNTGDVALLKGEAWEGNEGGGLIHRSPGVEPGQQRLLLTLDFT